MSRDWFCHGSLFWPMKQLKFLLILNILFLVSACNNKKESSERELFEVNVNASIKGETFINTIDDIKIVQLQQDSSVHISQIDKVIYEDSEFYVLDSELDNLFVFDKNGKLNRKISQFGNGPGEYADLNDFTIINNELYLLSRDGMKIIQFDLSGSFLKNIKLDYNPLLIENLNGNLGLYLTYFNEDNVNFKVLDKTGETISKGFPFPKGIFPMSLRYITGSLSANNLGVLYSEPSSSYIHQVDENGEVYKKYYLNFEDNFFPEEERYDFRKFFAEIQKGNLNFLTNYFAETDNVLSFRYNKKKPPKV